jgi:hypothetical protein
MKTFKDYIKEEAPANAVGTGDGASVAGAPIKRKGIKFIRRKARQEKNQAREIPMM